MAVVTETCLEYKGSLTLDANLMRAANLVPNEMALVANANTGARFETYIIEGPAESGVVCVNGAAARLAEEGDRIIVISSAFFDEKELEGFKPIVVHPKDKNRTFTVEEG